MTQLGVLGAQSSEQARGQASVRVLKEELLTAARTSKDLQYASHVVEALSSIGGNDALTAITDYAAALADERPEDELARGYYDEQRALAIQTAEAM